MKKKATDAEVRAFIEAVCPEAPDLYMASFDEATCLRDATNLIRELRQARADRDAAFLAAIEEERAKWQRPSYAAMKARQTKAVKSFGALTALDRLAARVKEGEAVMKAAGSAVQSGPAVSRPVSLATLAATEEEIL